MWPCLHFPCIFQSKVDLDQIKPTATDWMGVRFPIFPRTGVRGRMCDYEATQKLTVFFSGLLKLERIFSVCNKRRNRLNGTDQLRLAWFFTWNIVIEKQGAVVFINTGPHASSRCESDEENLWFTSYCETLFCLSGWSATVCFMPAAGGWQPVCTEIHSRNIVLQFILVYFR